ncbi:amidohydrolase [Paraburkholderia sp. BL25I1N1]|uniref:amidohydrolase family protein n=1 Tax=Paraburkholderia sp. BL25I1N1 TaxID=1938804 RepID=UPI000D072B12|nr:amidohydrolase family protein [Paraburkholderia sp. BL25I1N1]PRY07677.1 putative TIM-barrel fold metal-dependent hydrolase [Paraburkholderia sp. BL25I1N1]
MDCAALPILDCHQHFYDARRFLYPVFATRSEGFEALVGDYGALPRIYLPDDYARDTSALNVVGTVWAEFMSTDPVGEAGWAQELADATRRPDGIIALVDFSSPDLPATLDAYSSAQRIRCVRQHLGWHPANPLLRYAPRPDLMSDQAWRRGLASLRGRGVICELEMFAPQLPELASLATAFPDTQFVLPVMGWPLDLTSEGRAAWKREMNAVSACPNVAVKIFGLECIFGIHWTVAQVRPWILETIEVFGPGRCMFASHMPISKLACSFEKLYRAYFEVIAEFSVSEQRRLLHDTAAAIYKLS